MKFLNKENIIWACFTILVYLLTHGFVNSDYLMSYYTSSLLPEFTGVFLELLVVLLVVYSWQSKQEKERKKEKERILRKYIIFIMKKFFKFDAIPSEFSFYAENHNSNHAVLIKLLNEIESMEDGLLNDKIGEEFIKHCNVDIDAITALLPVSSELSNDHFKAWSRIVFYVKKIECLNLDDINEKDFKFFVTKLIGYIMDFDNATSEHKIFNGAK
ncbi:hypothetical protein ACFFLZ_06395 [Photobacterium aphoticum]|uniref:Uncharacterized protein n=1 Tax=Photobacterium aphoticum TaxID=754436 RepID=A0A0J1JIZ6_9GAMM|nr:hypothetical protein [Photobacterium aphoticum]KLV01992.1 hypothetical protein ABT58_06300 [Photobacterium aphoticum]PSU60238.1 hypothetical protein C9I90_01055 [Photobacterium aphoticum]GHA34288.1 hypothetical protein GCM10007086_04640 [Photobacterium aphoticum]